MLGDIIVGLDGKPVRSYTDLLNILDEKRVGDKVPVQLLRGGDRKVVVNVTLGERVLGQTE